MWSKRAIAQLDCYFPPRGACAFCGGKDARHRIWDTIMDRHAAGESVASLAEDYMKPRKAIKAILTVRPYHRGGKLLLP
jgi:hypothetical protein